ncbi:elongation of very long chain fatty acids protein AAEL008004-like [Anopheles ziemanni]|uniref:elongation of very long chain fatty acids protein AAEL008004-like n=1 Tax=Anopheles coustani TaxID=139045 RepID=UPI002657C74E|nr:elongation of very long chain fatty acids protein AAEL008004-like [Anopheles coustani]XP_058174022.1 elongation of very long chain fatty acids protein AAEL008004-like [Anopheles ziemanni]
MDLKDNFTDFTLASNYVMQLAIDEYQTDRNWTRLLDRYWNLVEELIGDPRAKHLPFMDNPLPTLGMILTYLVWVLIIGPTYMRDRKPMQLTNTLFYYNLFQVVLSGYMFYEHLMAGWARGYSLTCQPVDYSDDHLSRRMFNLCYIYYLSKLSEFADTIFFVLRKKKSQISYLHLYHHSLTPIEAWILTKFLAGGNATLPNIINNLVHTLMYFYYMLSAMGPRYQKYLWWKKYMTEIQIAQFVICIGHAINALLTDCAFPKFITLLLLGNASIFFVLFMNFYLENYRKQTDVKTEPESTAKIQEMAVASTFHEQQQEVTALLNKEH